MPLLVILIALANNISKVDVSGMSFVQFKHRSLGNFNMRKRFIIDLSLDILEDWSLLEFRLCWVEWLKLRLAQVKYDVRVFPRKKSVNVMYLIQRTIELALLKKLIIVINVKSQAKWSDFIPLSGIIQRKFIVIIILTLC